MLLFWPLVIPFSTAVLTMLVYRSVAAQRWLSLAGACLLLAVARAHPVAGPGERPLRRTGGRLARALRHQPGRRRAVGDHGAAGRAGRGGDLGLRLRRRDRGRGASRPLSAQQRAARGHLRRVPDRRHLQHVRLVRGDADRLLRPAGDRRRQGGARRRAEIRRAEPDRHGRLHLRRRPALRRDRRAQHGRPARPAARARGRDRDPRRRRLPDLRLRLQGGAVPGVLLAARLLSHARPSPPRRCSRRSSPRSASTR